MDGARQYRGIAFYLPQYHPIPENNAWWGEGFTEWTNVRKARPLYPGHSQPNLPGELGFYDLLVPEMREAQADLASRYGIEGFCYWHYWFAGKRLLQGPLEAILKSGKPSLPFCLAWANDSWTGIWHGAPERCLIEQTYPGAADDEAHFLALLPAFRDERYIRVDGKPLFLLYRHDHMPNPAEWAERWRELAAKHGLPGLFLVATSYVDWEAVPPGFDGISIADWAILRLRMRQAWQAATPLEEVAGKISAGARDFLRKRRLQGPEINDATELASRSQMALDAKFRKFDHDDFYPWVLSNWDNTPRSERRGWVLKNATPELFRQQLEHAARRLARRPAEHRLVFLKSWNEWAEGNYLEPDRIHGRAWLEAVRQTVWPEGGA